MYWDVRGVEYKHVALNEKHATLPESAEASSLDEEMVVVLST
jgi:hypothetical protein